MDLLKKTFVIGASLFLIVPVVALAQLTTTQGGTGSTSPSGILIGDKTIRLKTLTVGSGLTLTGTTLSALAGTAASSTLLGDANTFSGLDKFTNASSDFSGTWQTFSPAHFQVAGSYLTSALTGLKQTHGATQTGATQTLATSSDTNLGLTITTTTDTHTFTPTWIGTLADARIASAATWNAKLSTVTADAPLSGSGTSGSHLTISTAGTWSGNAGTATALAANGTNCTSQAATGVDASGNAEGCFTVASFAYPFPAGATTTLVTFTNSSTTLGSFSYASSTNYFGANLATCTGTNALTWIGGFFGCQAQPQGTVTSVTGTWPILSSGGATPNITWSGLATSSAISAASGLLYATGVNTFASISTSSAVQMSITGNAATVTTNANLTGVITSSGNTTSYGSQSAGVLGNSITGNTGVLATSTLYGTGAPGTRLVWANGVPSWVATSTNSCSSGITCTFASNVASFSIGSNALTLAMFPTIAANTVIGNLTGGTATPTAFATSSLFAGTTGQFGFFGGTGALVGTSSIFTSTASFIGIGSTTPFSRLSIGTGAASSSITVAEYKYGVSGNVATSTTANIDCNASTQIAWPLGASATTLTLINLTPGKKCIVVVQNPNQTAGALTWAVQSGAILKWAGGAAPTQTTTANTIDVWSFLATQGSSTMQINGAMSANF